MKKRMLVCGVGLALLASVCSAQVPSVMNYQGRLINGTNLYNGEVGLSLQLWSAATGGSLLGEDSNTVTVVDGLYATLLGDDLPADALARILNDNTNVYVRVLVNGAGLSPRERLASAAYAVIPGLKGVGNVQGGKRSAVGGGETNIILGDVSVIGGGHDNRIATNVLAAVIGGGHNNQVEVQAFDSVIAGGSVNRIGYQSFNSAIGGGVLNAILDNAAYSMIGGGIANTVATWSSYATIPGGSANVAAGNYTFAAGRRAKATNEGAFVWADSTDADFRSTANNQFLIRAAGGVGINTNGPFTDALVVGGGIRASESVHAESLVGEGSGITMLNGQNIQDGTISNLQMGVGSVTRSNLAVGSVSPDKLTEKYWAITGNNNVTAGVHFVGTTTTNPLELRVSNARVMRFENASVDSDPNVIGGHTYNLVTPGRIGATIAGGGGFLEHNEVRDNYGAVGGGAGNVAGDNTSKDYATVAGGQNNAAEGSWSAVPGGRNNRASGFYALAAGRQAKAIHDGAFVWADSTAADFSSTASDQFIVRAAGGVGVNESDPRQQLSVGSYLDLYSGASSAPSQPSIRGSSLGNLFLNATNNTYINYDSGHDLIINLGGGKVGIGTNNPAHALSVNGDAQLTGVVWADSFVGDGSGLTDINGGNIMPFSVTTDQLAQAYWRLDGNANAVADVSFIGTTLPVTPLELRASNTRVLLLDGTGYKVIGGSQYNCATGSATGVSIGGGGEFVLPNRVSDSYGTVGGGHGNLAGNGNPTASDAPDATVSGGKANSATEDGATVGGGRYNVAGADGATIGGGLTNQATGYASTVAGGFGNVASGENTAIGGGTNNRAEHAFSTVAGGRENRAAMAYVFIGGGYNNFVNGDGGTIAGGMENYVAADDSTIGGGATNKALGEMCTIGGGYANVVTNDWTTIGGGQSNKASGVGSVIGGGQANRTYDQQNTIAGGWANITTGDYSSVGGGLYNYALGQASTVPGGQANEAKGAHSFAAGFRAKATNDGAFVWADSQNIDLDSLVDDSVTFRCQGGVRFLSGAGGSDQMVSWVPGGGPWTYSSDRALKEGWAGVDSRAVLEKVAELPITEWNYKGYPQRHIGPMAQDFHAAFPLNESDTTLNSLDLDGVSLAAIQGLYQVVREENTRLTRENEELRARLSAIEQRLGIATR